MCNDVLLFKKCLKNLYTWDILKNIVKFHIRMSIYEFKWK